MQQKVQLKYFHPALQIGMVSWKEVYLLSPELVPLHAEVYKGRLIFRAKGSSKRISYLKIKQGLVKTSQCIFENVPDWV